MSSWIESVLERAERYTMERNELLKALKGVMPEGIETVCDECGGNPEKCPSNCDYRIARALIAKVEQSK